MRENREAVKFYRSLAFRLLLIVLVSGTFPLILASVVSRAFLSPYFYRLEEESAITEINRIVDIIERDLNNTAISARGISSYILRDYPHQDYSDIMDIYALDFLSIAPEGLFREMPGWIRNDTGIQLIPDTAVFLESVMDGPYAPGRISTLGFISVGKDSDIFVMTASSADIETGRIIIGHKLNTALENYLEDYPEITVNTISTPDGMDQYTVSISINRRGIYFSPATEDNVLIRRTPRSTISSLVIPVPYLNKGLMVEVEQPSIILESSTRKLSRILMSVALLMLLQTILLGLWAIYKVSRPLNILIRRIDDWDAVRSPDFGNLKDRSDEIGTLIRTFIRMSDEIMLKNRLLKDQATRDALTGLYNRRYFDEILHNEWDRHIRDKSSIAVIMADIDYFKIYNDTYGHQKGDECLRQVAQTCSSSLLRPGDTSFRYGGEEFAFILTDTGPEGAIAVAERLRNSVKALNIPHRNKPGGGSVTLSLGVSVSGSDKGRTIKSASELLERADKALYKAKESGRNRVISI